MNEVVICPSCGETVRQSRKPGPRAARVDSKNCKKCESGVKHEAADSKPPEVAVEVMPAGTFIPYDGPVPPVVVDWSKAIALTVPLVGSPADAITWAEQFGELLSIALWKGPDNCVRGSAVVDVKQPPAILTKG